MDQWWSAPAPSTRLPARYRSRPLVHRQVHANHVVDCGSVNDMHQRLVKARRMIRRRIREGQPFMTRVEWQSND
ncbi:hypothetical protein GBJ43_01745 [Bifidobacterium longum]|nr:hypothetical protein GBJ40_05605 [Bifidobacterium longum]KAB6926548.1 hypothetical protein GBJ42_00515 [Bifidobacterium longum]KAB6931215.1 hypothetical protein GBJ38_01880 [Bifidobacterium longum]KAB6932491.1 hypothetical protein GBJ27_00515 [Bifidobacterium longum]KAB6935206.1 hypothetical protein GBJ43_01745 [Bifidobacterium longum]